MCRVVKRETFGIVSPMGGSVQMDYRVSEDAFQFWAARVARIPAKRWMALIDVVEALHKQVEGFKAETAFTHQDFEALRKLGTQIDGERSDQDLP